MTYIKNKGLGWKPDIPDIRDHKFMVDFTALGPLPSKFDVEEALQISIDVYDQSHWGSCTGNGVAHAISYCTQVEDWKALQKQGKGKDELDVFVPSRLFIYYNERSLEGTVKEDSGAQIRDGIKSVNKWGVCDEKTWTYDDDNVFAKPSKQAYKEAILHQALSYKRVDNKNINYIKAALVSGFPVVFGFTVYDSFMTEEVAKSGIMPLPSTNESIQGGHCVVAVGYDDETKMVRCRNSWGPGWGQKGYFQMPYEYITNPNAADDFWYVNFVEVDTNTNYK